jgi:predicted dehydrogenase
MGTQEVVRSAVVGTGIVGQNEHIPILELHPQAELVAICDADETVLQETETEADVGRYTDVEAMLENESLDSVHVCTPPQTRVPIVETLARENIDILFEKPLAASTDDVDRLAELADEHDVTMSVVHHKLFTPHYREATRRVRDGGIGEVVGVTMLYSEQDAAQDSPRGEWVYELPGGEIGEGLPHQAYLPLAFVDGLGEINCVSKQRFADLDRIGFDGVAIEATDDTGRTLVTIRVLYNSTSQDTLILNGTQGELTVDHLRKGVFDTTTTGEGAKSLVTGSVKEGFQLGFNILTTGLGFVKRLAYRRMDDERGEEANGHFVLIDRYLDAVQTGSEPPVTLQDGRETIELIEALE